MCCHPYDYCGPVHQGRGCGSCSLSGPRAGSILSGGSQVVASPMPMPGPRNTPTPAARRAPSGQMQLGEVPGSEQILSVTERTVESPTVVADSSAEPAGPATEPAKPLPSKGWTARRPTGAIMR